MNDGVPKIDLAAEPDFALGALRVSPSACRVAGAAGEERVEPRVMEVLVTLARAGGRTVTRDQLVAACWDGRAVSDDAITRAITKVRQLGRSADPPHFTLETVPRVGFRLEAGIARPAEPAPQQPSKPAASRRGLWAATVFVVAALLGLTATQVFGLGSPDRTSTGRVALKPFTAAADDAELAQLSAHIGEAMARLLTHSGVPTVAVLAPTAVSLKTEFEITGIVERVRDQVAVRASIRDAHGLVLWSGKFERRSDEAAGLDQEAGATAAGILDCALAARNAAPAMGSDLFSLFLNACDSVNRTGALEPPRLLAAKAPENAEAQALLAHALAFAADELSHVPDAAEALRREAKAAVDRALALDPATARAHAVQGMRLGPESRYVEREQALRRAAELDPDMPFVGINQTILLREVGRLKAAREVADRTSTDPRIIGGLPHLIFLSAMLGDFETANRIIARLEIGRPEWGRSIRKTIALWWDEPQKVAALIAGPGNLSFSSPAERECFKAHFASLAEAKGAAVGGLPRACVGALTPDWEIRMLARQGDIDAAYERMNNKYLAARPMTFFLFYPEMKAFRRDARFMPLAERLGLLAYWRATNQWPDFCAEPDLPYKCA